MWNEPSGKFVNSLRDVFLPGAEKKIAKGSAIIATAQKGSKNKSPVPTA